MPAETPSSPASDAEPAEFAELFRARFNALPAERQQHIRRRIAEMILDQIELDIEGEPQPA